MIITLVVRTFASTAYLNFTTMDQFLRIYSPNKYSDSRTNFKLSHNSIINNCTTKKKISFQEQQRQQQQMKIRAHIQKYRLNIH